MDYTDCWYMASCPRCPDECGATCLRFAEMLHLVESSNIPKARWYTKPLLCYEDYDAFVRLQTIKLSIEEWVKSGNNLYLYSEKFGNGKTSWAIKLMLSYFNAIWAGNSFRTRGIFLSMPEFLDRNREVISNRDPEFIAVRQAILECDLVIWDDITSTKMTDYNHSMLLNYLDARILANKSNIFTGNVGYEQMTDLLGGRLASRICNTSESLQFIDADKRGLK